MRVEGRRRTGSDPIRSDSIRFHGPNPSSWPENSIAGSRCTISVQACCDAACYIGRNLLTLRQRPRLLDAGHVSSNVTPCRVTEIVHRASAGCLLAGGADPMFLIESSICGLVTFPACSPSLFHAYLPGSPLFFFIILHRAPSYVFLPPHQACTTSTPSSLQPIAPWPFASRGQRIFWSPVTRVELSNRSHVGEND